MNILLSIYKMATITTWGLSYEVNSDHKLNRISLITSFIVSMYRFWRIVHFVSEISFGIFNSSVIVVV